MSPRIDLVAFVNNVKAQNPNATQQDLKVKVKDGLQELNKNGTKVSPREIAKAQGMVCNANTEQLKANFITNHTKTADKAVKKLNESNAVDSYKSTGYSPKMTENHNMTKENVQRVPKDRPRKNNNASRKASLIEGTKDLSQNGPASLDEHIKNLKAAGNIEELRKVEKEMAAIEPPEEYISSKKQRKIKKELEIKSKNEHRKARAEQFKTNRNKKYCTENGIMTSKARKAYNKVKAQLSKPSKVVIAEPKLSNKSAKESFEVFMQKAPERLPVDSAAKVKKSLKGKWALVGSAFLAAGALVGTLVSGHKEQAEYRLSA